MKQNKYSKLLKTWRVVKLTTPKLVYRSGDKEYFGFNRFGPGWIVELFKSQYINILTYRPLSGSYYVKLLAELISSKKGLININITIKNVFMVSC